MEPAVCPARHAGSQHARTPKLPTVTRTGNLAQTPKCLKPTALGDDRSSAERIDQHSSPDAGAPGRFEHVPGGHENPGRDLEAGPHRVCVRIEYPSQITRNPAIDCGFDQRNHLPFTAPLTAAGNCSISRKIPAGPVHGSVYSRRMAGPGRIAGAGASGPGRPGS